jgi:hypothetical protein
LQYLIGFFIDRKTKSDPKIAFENSCFGHRSPQINVHVNHTVIAYLHALLSEHGDLHIFSPKGKRRRYSPLFIDHTVARNDTGGGIDVQSVAHDPRTPRVARK